MLIQLMLVTVMIVMTILIHGAGITALARGMRIETSVAETHHHFSRRRAGAIEGINDVLLLGWSAAFFVTVVARLPK